MRNAVLDSLWDVIKHDWDVLLFANMLIVYGAASIVVARPVDAPELMFLLRDITFIAAGALLMAGGISKLYYLRVAGTILYAAGLVVFSLVVLQSTKSTTVILLLALALAGLGELKRMRKRNKHEIIIRERERRIGHAPKE